MAEFFKLVKREDEVANQFFRMTQAASDNREKEMQAVIIIQKVYNGSKVRERWHAVVNCTRLIQRVIRGTLGRSRTRSLRIDRTRRFNAVFFHHCATIIQKYFRGQSSRRHLHDHYGRKGYLEKVAMRGQWTVDYLQREHAAKLDAAKSAEEAKTRYEFENLAGDLHHLVSTKVIAGVYNPPYNDALPRAFEKPIEQHLRDCCRAQVPKSLRRPRHRTAIASSSPCREGYLGASHVERGHEIAPTGPPQDLPEGRMPHHSRSASAGRMQKIQGPFRSKEQIEVSNAKAHNTYRSIQSTAPFSAVDDDRKMQQRLSKLTRVSPIDFVSPGFPPTRPPPSSVHASVPYREHPVELRNDYNELPKIRDKPPFFTALPRDQHFDGYHEHHLLPYGQV